MASGAPPHSSQSSLTSYEDIDDDAWANFDLSGAIDQHQQCSSSQPTATTAGAATTGTAASSMCDDDDAWASFDLSGAIEQHQRSTGSQPTAATAPGAAPTSGTGDDGILRDQEWLDITRTELRCGELMKVCASAGAGKSTVLREYAAMRPHLRCLYLTFNKEVAWLGLGLGLGSGLGLGLACSGLSCVC